MDLLDLEIAFHAKIMSSFERESRPGSMVQKPTVLFRSLFIPSHLIHHVMWSYYDIESVNEGMT